MIASTSHDMKTPLNSALNLISILEKTVTSEESLNLIQMVKNSCYFLLYLIYDTIDFS